MHKEAPIIQKTYDFYRELYLTVGKMPKKDKYTLGEKVQKITLDLLELFITASYSKLNKLLILEKASAKLELLKILIRLSNEIKAINSKKYLYLEELLQEIGRMLGGWLRSLR